MNYLDLLTDDLIEKILEVSTDDYDNQLNILDSKIKKINNRLYPLEYEYIEEEDYLHIDYGNASYCMDKNLFERIYGDNIVFIQPYDEFFSGYISDTYNNPSYLDVLIEVNNSIIHTGDSDHRFLEDVYQIGNENVYDYVGINPKENYKYYGFFLGS
jgi:hypothetical protein